MWRYIFQHFFSLGSLWWKKFTKILCMSCTGFFWSPSGKYSLTHPPKKQTNKQKLLSLPWVWRRGFNEIVTEITELGMLHDPSPPLTELGMMHDPSPPLTELGVLHDPFHSSKSGPKWTSTYHLTMEDGWWYVDRKHFFITLLFETWTPWLANVQ